MIERRWLMLAILFAARTSIAYQFESVAAASFTLVSEAGFNYARLGVLIGCHMLPGVALALPSGLLAQRFRSKPVVLAGLALMALGGLVMMDLSAPALFAGRIVSGAGGVLLNVVLTRMVTDWFSEREAVLALAIFVASWPLGIAVGLVTVPAVALVYGWSGVTAAGVLPCLVALLLTHLFYVDPAQRAVPASRGAPPSVRASTPWRAARA